VRTWNLTHISTSWNGPPNLLYSLLVSVLSLGSLHILFLVNKYHPQLHRRSFCFISPKAVSQTALVTHSLVIIVLLASGSCGHATLTISCVLIVWKRYRYKIVERYVGHCSSLANDRSGGNFDHVYEYHQRSNFTSFLWWWGRRWSAKRWAFIHNWHGLFPEFNEFSRRESFKS
jgi:hypothetical protein